MTDFLEEQKKFLTEKSPLPQTIQDITKAAKERPAPPHIRANDISDIFQLGELLGGGAYGNVKSGKLQAKDDCAQGSPSNILALKCVRKPDPTGSNTVRRTTPEFFAKELNILNRCKGTTRPSSLDQFLRELHG